MNADGTNPVNLTRNTPDAALDDLESLAIATVDLIRAGDLTLDVVDGWVMPTLAEDTPSVPVPRRRLKPSTAPAAWEPP